MKALVTYDSNGKVSDIVLTTALGFILDKNKIPKDYKNQLGFSQLDWENVIYPQGFRDVVLPEFDNSTHRRTRELIEIGNGKNKKVTYKVVPFSSDELQIRENTKKTLCIERLNPLMGNSRRWLRAILMGKTVNDDLEYFEDVYRNKYNQCLDVNGSFDSLLEMESQLEGFSSLQDYKNYVIEKWERGLGFYNGAKMLLEVFRKRVIKDIELDDIDKATLRMDELDSLPDNLKPEDFQTEFNKIMAL